jgi:hypothetical protein
MGRFKKVGIKRKKRKKGGAQGAPGQVRTTSRQCKRAGGQIRKVAV